MSIQLAQEINTLKQRVSELEKRLESDAERDLAEVIKRIETLEQHHRPGPKPKAK